VTAWQIPVFGVRHLSPSGAWHLRKFLDRTQPKVVLIEGLSDADELVPHITKKGTKPPIAILAYTDTLPVRTLVYPIARYSPEYQAMVWAKENNARVEFIDLPSDIFLALADAEEEAALKARKAALEAAEKEAQDAAAAAPPANAPGQRTPSRGKPAATAPAPQDDDEEENEEGGDAPAIGPAPAGSQWSPERPRHV
jgi:hypothetical protein